MIDREQYLSTKRALDSINEARKEQTSEGIFYHILERVRVFEESLDEAHEVGVQLVNFGQTITFSVSRIGYINPLLIVFQGHTDSGDPIELIQHISQISFVLIKLKRNPEIPKQPIGFI